MNLWRVPINEKTGRAQGSPEPVTTPSSYSAYASFSLDGGLMAYMQEGRTANIYKVAFDPGREVLAGPLVPVTQGWRVLGAVDLSADGRWIAFGAAGKQEDIFVVRADGSGLRQLTDDMDRDRGPRWAADERQLAFYSNRSGFNNIWLIHPDGSGLQQLTFTKGAVDPIWSPDGSRLAYTVPGVSCFIMQVAIPWKDESVEKLPAPGESGRIFNAWSWSADGRKLAGSLFPEGGTWDHSRGIAAYSLESHKYEQLAPLGSHPYWLADSRRLLFVHQGKIFLLDSRSKKYHELFSNAPQGVHATSLRISRDNRLISFALDVTEADIWLMSSTL
jgi:Tol biopolymer transport system component